MLFLLFQLGDDRYALDAGHVVEVLPLLEAGVCNMVRHIEIAKMFGVPYFPNVSMGWDSSPRAAQEDEFGDFGAVGLTPQAEEGLAAQLAQK